MDSAVSINLHLLWALEQSTLANRGKSHLKAHHLSELEHHLTEALKATKELRSETEAREAA